MDTTNINAQSVITEEDAQSIVETLSDEFNVLYGKKAYMNVYILDFSNKETMILDNFNRSAHPFLTAYFLARALNKDEALLSSLKSAFAKEAATPWKGKDTSLELDTDEIITELEESIERLLWNTNSNNDNDNHHPSTERHIA